MHRVLTTIVVLVCIAFVFPQQPPHPVTHQENETLLRWLYRLIWPKDTKVNLGNAIIASTEKSAPGAGVSRLYLVNASTGTASEWPSAAGANEPTICPDATDLFYRRDTRLFKETVRLTSEGVSAATSPRRVQGVVLTRLYACTQDGKGGVALWAENGDGTIRVLRVLEGSASWEDLPSDNILKILQPQKVAEDLQYFRSMRPDGFVVWIRDHQLLGQKGASTEPSLLVHSDHSFSGSPSWIGDSQFLFVTAETAE